MELESTAMGMVTFFIKCVIYIFQFVSIAHFFSVVCCFVELCISLITDRYAFNCIIDAVPLDEFELFLGLTFAVFRNLVD